MNFNNFTIKSQEAIQKAVEITRGAGTQAIEPVCLLKGVIDEGESVLKFIFQKIGANPAVVIRQVDMEIAALPKVSGQEPYLSRTSNDVLQKALDESKSLGDQYVTLEALLLHYGVIFGAYKALSDDFFTRYVLVVACIGLGSGGDYRFGEALVLAEAFRKFDAAYFAYTRRIFTPSAAGEIAADNHLYAETLAADACCSHWVDFGELPVRHFLACGIEEVVGNLIEHLSLVGNSFGEYDIESRYTVGGYHYEDIAFDGVNVTHLAVVNGRILVREMEICACECHDL